MPAQGKKNSPVFKAPPISLMYSTFPPPFRLSSTSHLRFTYEPLTSEIVDDSLQKTRKNSFGCPKGGEKDGEKRENGGETRGKDESKTTGEGLKKGGRKKEEGEKAGKS